MATSTLDQGLELRQIAEDAFENVHKPWTWPGGPVVPGGLLMGQCAAAAYRTVDNAYRLDTLHINFLSAPNPELPIHYAVQRVSRGRRFAVRLVTASQKNKNVVVASLSFINVTTKEKVAMTHTVKRESPYTISKIEQNDLEVKGKVGPPMAFQRLPVYHPDPSTKVPQQAIVTSAAQILPAISHPPGHVVHTLGLLNLSDYHVLDAPMQMYGITFGLPAPDDPQKKPTEREMKLSTSLNHSVYFHRHDDFRVDDLCYIEVKSPLAGGGTAFIQTRIFDGQGSLIASCVQEGYYVFKDSVQSKL